MCKEFKFDHTNKCYMHNPAAVLENETYKLQWDIDIQTDHLISARRRDLIIINNKKRENFQNCGLCCPADHKIKLKEYKKKDKHLDLARKLKKTMKVTFIRLVIRAFGTVTKELFKGLEDLEVGGRAETIQTTASLRTARILRKVLTTQGDLRRLAVTQTPVRDHQLKLMWKTLKSK